MTDTVTIGIYRVEDINKIKTKEGQDEIKEGFKSAVNDMLVIKDKLIYAAEATNNVPPKFIVSFLLIPDWDSAREGDTGVCQQSCHLNF